jgi:EmrB/QacA subfamily drug resistance transporter
MRKWLPLVAICLGAFILLVDVTIVNVALPSMADDLHASFSSLQWVMDVYALALAALLLVAGSLADLFGHRRLYAGGLTVFALASLACALAPDAGALITARAVQGAGGAAMFATSAALVSLTYKGRDRGVAFGVWGAVNGAAAAAGPVLGGLLTEGFGWQAIFLVNLPIAVAAVALTLRALPVTARGRGRLDLPGAVTFTLSAAALTYALIRGGEHGWSGTLTVGAFVVSGAAAAAFVAVEARSAHPMLDLALLRRPSFAGLLGGALLLQAAAFSGLVFVSLWLQTVLKLSPIRGGLALMPLAGASFVVAAVAGRFMHRLAPRWPIGIGLLLISGGSALMWASISATSGQTSLFAGLVVVGIGVGLGTPVLVAAAVESVPPQRAGMAGGAVNTFRQLGYAFGVAVLGTVLTSRIGETLSEEQSHALAGGGASGLRAAGVPEQAMRAAFASGLNTAAVVAGVAGIVAGAAVLLLVKGERGARKGAEAPTRGAVRVG